MPSEDFVLENHQKEIYNGGVICRDLQKSCCLLGHLISSHSIQDPLYAPLLRRQAERGGLVQPEEEKAAGRPDCSISVIKGSL